MVASHTETPLGVSKWLGKATPHKYNLADMQGTRANHVAYPRAGWYYSVNPIQAIYFSSLARTVTVGSPYPKARLYGWLPLSDASDIISIAIGHPQYYSLMQYFSVIGHYKCRTRYCRISHSSQRDFVKKYSNFDPKLRASSWTNCSSVENNAIFEDFCKALTDRWLHEY